MGIRRRLGRILRRGLMVVALMAAAASHWAAPAPARAQDRAPGAFVADFGGIWEARDNYGAQYTLSLQVRPDSSVSGELTSLGSGGRYYGSGGKYAGTLSGSINGAGVLAATWLQPSNPNTQGAARLKLNPDGTPNTERKSVTPTNATIGGFHRRTFSFSVSSPATYSAGLSVSIPGVGRATRFVIP